VNLITIFAILFPIFGFQAISFEKAAEEIVQTGISLNHHQLCPATSGNFSQRLDEQLIAVTASGKHKGELTAEDILIADLEGKVQGSEKKPSAETALHTMLYKQNSEIGAILHTHSTNGIVLTRLLGFDTSLITEGYEIHKIFPNIGTHESRIETPIFENTQDIPVLAAKVSTYLEEHPLTFGFLIHGHGFYTWGKDMKEVKNRIEAFEQLFECELKIRTAHGSK